MIILCLEPNPGGRGILFLIVRKTEKDFCAFLKSQTCNSMIIGNLTVLQLCLFQ